MECGSISLEFLTRTKKVRCKPNKHLSETVMDKDTGNIVLVSERKFPVTSLVDDEA